jgi:hypothetical protein
MFSIYMDFIPLLSAMSQNDSVAASGLSVSDEMPVFVKSYSATIGTLYKREVGDACENHALSGKMR